jgi:branched-chain amino acid transport system ATP-binding protein
MTMRDTALLEVTELRAGYGQVRVLHGLDFVVHEGEAVVILGANGAGQSSTLRAVCAMIASVGTACSRVCRSVEINQPGR